MCLSASPPKDLEALTSPRSPMDWDRFFSHVQRQESAGCLGRREGGERGAGCN